jgi:hypothetical protein
MESGVLLREVRCTNLSRVAALPVVEDKLWMEWRHDVFALIIVLLIVALAALAWVNHGIYTVTVNQAAHMTLIDSIRAELKTAQEQADRQMACGWYDDGWPSAKPSVIAMEAWKREFHRGHGGRDPKPWKNPDEYATQMFIAEYKAISSPHQRKDFLRDLHKAEVWMAPEFLELIYADENTYVRAWAAGHLNTEVFDVRNYEPDLLQDPEPIVRAALWSNPECQNLPWKDRRTGLSEAWKEQLRTMSQIERLGLMRNPKLEMRFVVALMEASSDQLEMSEYEHEMVLCAAAVNPDLIWGSRSTGRDGSVACGEGYPPPEEYGLMWTLSLDKWIDTPVPEHFFKHIQTTPEIKKAIYQRLLEKEEDRYFKNLRVVVILSCDPLIDGPVLKMAWNDPDQECREIAKQQIGVFGDFVGVQGEKRRWKS